MKGYYVPYGYMGYVNGRYLLFANEADYLEYLEGDEGYDLSKQIREGKN